MYLPTQLQSHYVHLRTQVGNYFIYVGRYIHIYILFLGIPENKYMLLKLVKKYPNSNELMSRYLSRYIYHLRLKTSQYLLPLGHQLFTLRRSDRPRSQAFSITHRLLNTEFLVKFLSPPINPIIGTTVSGLSFRL